MSRKFVPEFCPYCGSELGEKEVEGRPRLHCFECERTIWRNASPVAAVAVRKGQKILLIKRGIEPGKGEWSLPAGFLEYHENPREAASRELEEETGLKVKSEELKHLESKNIERFPNQRLVAIVFMFELSDKPRIISAGSDAKEAEFKSPGEVVESDEKLRECFKSSIRKAIGENFQK